MAFNLSAFLAILPDFLIAGILSLIFFLELRNIGIRRKDRPVFILVREDGLQAQTGDPSNAYTELEKRDEGPFYKSIKNIQLAMLSVNIWILLTIILLPSYNIAGLLPALSRDQQFLVYSSLGAVFLFALLSTVILRISNTWPKIATTFAIIATGIFLIFYIPSMQWLSTYSLIIRGIILYAIIASALSVSYGFFTLPYRKIEKLSIAGTFSAYVFTSAILFVNLVQSLRV